VGCVTQPGRDGVGDGRSGDAIEWATPPDKNLVYVYVDKVLVTKSDSNGWVFDSTDPTSATGTLTGTYYQNMSSGVTSQIQIVFGCPNTVPASVIP
jgi:hypothetical protein